jgi:serine/threonine protein kinase
MIIALVFGLVGGVPNLFSPYEDVELPEVGVQRLHIGDLVHRTTQATLFHVKDHEDKLIRYEVNCVENSAYSLSRHYWFLNTLRSLSVAPIPLYLSPSTALPLAVSPKTDFLMDQRIREMCFRRRAPVRFMVMSAEGYSLDAWIDGQSSRRIEFEWALRTLRQLIKILEVIHTRGIVHGDIHAGNVVAKKLSQGIKLIDFERAKLKSEIVATPRREPLSYFHVTHSPFELMGFHSSMRDDVFRAVLLGAHMIGGDAWFKHYDSITNAQAMYQFKAEEFLFDAGDFNLAQLFPSGVVPVEVRQNLEAILALVRDAPGVMSVPNYAGIIEHIDAILSAAKRT